VHLNVGFSNETGMKQFLDFLYQKSAEGIAFTGLLEAMVNDTTIVTAVHNIKSNKGSNTAGVDEKKMNDYFQMPKADFIELIKSNFSNYKPKPARRVYIPKSNGKQRPLGIPAVLDRIIQECVRIIIEPICEARFYPHSYGFRPYRAQKHAIRDIINVINAGSRSKDQAVWAVEGDIKGCFDNIDHRILLKKLWRIGIHDKRVLKIISQMLKAGYIESDMYYETELGSPQGGILSPLISNVYLNDFDWYIGRCYMEPHRQCKHKDNDTRRLKWSGITPKYNYRFADDWVILTSTEREALRLKKELTKYFKARMRLELSQEKTYVTDLRNEGIHFLGFTVKAERKNKTPDPRTWTDNLIGKPFPDKDRLTKKIHNIQDEVRKVAEMQGLEAQAAQIQRVNAVIMGVAEYIQTSICSKAYHAIDRRVDMTALSVWKKLYPTTYNKMQVPLKQLCNLPQRHAGYDSKTFAIQVEGKWFGLTYAFITHSNYEKKPFDQKMTPYTEDGRKRYQAYRKRHKPLPLDRPSVNTPEDIRLAIACKGSHRKYNFEYFMNREYAFNRDKGKCKCCGEELTGTETGHCHHVSNTLHIDEINKVKNLAWLCEPCHRMVHNGMIPPGLTTKVVKKIEKYRKKLNP
jgi:RNA-directed DNA polymerase